MDHKQAISEIEESFGFVPSFFKLLPDEYLGSEWDLQKRLTLEETLIPNKYKELMGLSVAAVTRCKYCTYYHTVDAKIFGATDEEIEEEMHCTKQVIGWSTYINGMQMDYDEFKKEMDRIAEHVKSAMAAQ
jgi:AhpD family alkylhydroperoxidase